VLHESAVLKPCHECKTPVSTQARRCPHCGAEHPTATAGQANQARGMRTLFLIVLGLCALVWLMIRYG
jgi:Zn finger protein HypA/HybF involved in hydrogenase expression